MITFTIATSWDNKLITQLNDLNGLYNRKITEVYGSLKTSITGSGRPAYRLPDISWEQMASHIKCAHQHNIKFNYVMNSPDFQNKQNNTLWKKELVNFLSQLVDYGIDCITITHIDLIKLVKKEFPKLKIYLSLIAGVDNLEQARRYENAGIDVIHLNPHTINRNFKAIETIVKSMNIPVVLYANIPCLNNCPWRDGHYKFFGYASQNGNEQIKINYDPFVTRCSLEYLNNPVLLLKSPFIRPEDIGRYKEIGINHFKLSDRSESTEFLVKTATAYLQGEFHGNLFDLIFRGGSKFKAGIKSIHPEVTDMEIPITIDNNKLTALNFIEQIRTLRGQKLEKFYQKATNQCVNLQQTNELAELKKYLSTFQKGKSYASR